MGIMKRVIGSTIAILFILQSVSFASAGGDLPTITTYHTPCAHNTAGTVSTFHGMNRDGKPPLDPTRRTYDFHCVDKRIYSPTDTTVWGYTPKYGGVLLMQDSINKVCLTILGMNTFPIVLKQQIKAGDYLGTYGRVAHVTAVDGYCADAGFYDVDARTREHPIAWIELGKVLAADIKKTAAIEFVSRNAGGEVEAF